MPSSPAASVLVVGGGLTSASVCRALCRSLPAASLQISVWEAFDSIGGRFHTERAAAPAPNLEGCCDTGAQYVTVTDDAAVAKENAELYDELKSVGILKPMRGRIQGGRAADGNSGENYIAPLGLSSVVGHIFASCDVRPTCSRRAVSLRAAAHTSGAAASARSGWEVLAADGHSQRFDAVVLTQPLPELLPLLDTGDAGEWLDAAAALEGDDGALAGGMSRASCEAIQYSSRYALTLFFAPSALETFAREIDWVARYVSKEEDDALVYLCHDSAKRASGDGGDGASGGTGLVSLIAHTSVPYGIRRIVKEGAAEEDVVGELQGRVKKLLPWLPEPTIASLKTWRVSQVRTPLALAGGAACWRLAPPAGGDGDAPPLVLAGDAFSPLGSRFDGCVQSGEHAAKAVLEALQVE